MSYNYQQLVEAITDELLSEVVKVSLGHPTSRNVLYGARYGDFMKKLRFELADRNFPGAERVSVEPVPHGQSRIMTSVVDTPTVKRVAAQSNKSVPEVEAEFKNNTIIGLEPAHSSMLGVRGQAGTLAHEAGHAISNHPYSDASTAIGAAEVAREAEAWDVGKEFAKHAGLDADTSLETSALNRYRADNGIKTEPEDPAASKMWNARAQRKIDSDYDWSSIAYGKKLHKGMQSLTMSRLNSFLARHEGKK